MALNTKREIDNRINQTFSIRMGDSLFVPSVGLSLSWVVRMLTTVKNVQGFEIDTNTVAHYRDVLSGEIARCQPIILGMGDDDIYILDGLHRMVAYLGILEAAEEEAFVVHTIILPCGTIEEAIRHREECSWQDGAAEPEMVVAQDNLGDSHIHQLLSGINWLYGGMVKSIRLPNADLYLEHYRPAASLIVRYAKSAKMYSHVSRAYVIAPLLLMHEADPVKFEEFLSVLFSIGTKEGRHWQPMRKYLMGVEKTKIDYGPQYGSRIAMDMCYYWNRFQDGDIPHSIKYTNRVMGLNFGENAFGYTNKHNNTMWKPKSTIGVSS